jgi:type IV pilus assembly protein PilQ
MMTAMNLVSGVARPRWAALASLSLCLALVPALALAENVLRNASYQTGSGGAVDVVLEFAEPVAGVQTFTTDNPPRIAIDVPDTRNGLNQRRIAVGSGATSAISAVEGQGRTRVVIDLFRTTSFETRTEGNRLIVSVAGGAMAGTAAIAANPDDPSKRVNSGLALSNIDFRRGDDGAGRLVLSFDGEGVLADMRTEKSQVVIDVANASLPDSLRKRLDVSDFATPARSIESRPNAGGARIVIDTGAAFEALAYQTGNEYVVEVVPIKAAADPVAAALASGAPPPKYTGKPVTFNFQDIPVRTVLQLIADESNLNIVAADTVQGNITLRLQNVPWDQALDIMLRAKQLDKRRDGDVVWIGPQKELADFEQQKEDARIALEERSETITEFIPINYGIAEDIAKLLTEESKTGSGGGGGGGGSSSGSQGFLSERGSISFDRRTNTLLVIDIPKRVSEIKRLVTLLDRAVDQVMIEARIVVASDDFAREIGSRFGLRGTNNKVNTLTTSGSLESLANFRNTTIARNNELATNALDVLNGSPPSISPSDLTAVSFGTIDQALNVNLPVNGAPSLGLSILALGLEIDLELSALQSEGRGEVISNPRVITSNQREAIIRQGDEVGFVTIAPQQGGTSVPIPNVQFKDVLLELKVTPTITQDGRVFLSMAIKKDEVSGFIDTSIGQVPQIQKREVTTAVLVDNGQTVVVGGVYEFKSREDLSKVPFLGDIPGLGALFRKKGRSANKAELLIFVTPQILRSAGAAG